MRINQLNLSKFTALTSLALCLSLAACTAPKEVPVDASEINAETPELNNIIGGGSVAEGSALSRSVVLLVNSQTREVCTAALIGGNFALTAAHCVDREDVQNMFVFFAAKPNKNTERRQVVNAKVSPYWDHRKKEEKNTSDIAVIKFAGNGLPNGYQPVKFLEDNSVLVKGMASVILGYGVNEAAKQTGAGALRFTILKISDPNFSPTEKLLNQSKGNAACYGDSGGPAFVYRKDKSGKTQFYMWGIANHPSKDDVDNLCNKSVVYTDATVFATWIGLVKESL